jgi:hypothetical protein
MMTGITQHWAMPSKDVWSEIKETLADVPPRAEVRWVSYSLRPPKHIRSWLLERELTIEFVGRKPGGNLYFRSRDLDKVRVLTTTGLCKAYFYEDTPNAFDSDFDEDPDPPGPLHAKFIVARWGGGGGLRYRLVAGSFNADGSSLGESCESLLWTSNQGSGEKAWADAGKLIERAEEVRVEHIHEGPSSGGPLEFDDPPARNPPKPRRHPPRRRPPATYPAGWLGLLKEALDGFLCNWPAHGQDWQWDQYKELDERQNQRVKRGEVPFLLLYLPVGVGKTFIALRWLLEQLSDDAAGVFLVPNQWVQLSVRSDLEKVVRRAAELSGGGYGAYRFEDLAAAAESHLRVLRPSEIRKFRGTASAVVADECHNWSPFSRGAEGQYTWALNQLRDRKPPVLGLSATPCRVEVGKYVVRHFVHAFCLHPDPEAQVSPDMTLDGAVQGGLLAKPRFRPLLEDRLGEVRSVLRAGRSDLVRMGDYSPVTLREVWEVLARDLRSLVDEILDKAEYHRAGRAVVFIPPVTAEQTTPFVNELKKRVGQRWGNGAVFDFRSAGAQGRAASETFKAFCSSPRQPGHPPILVTIDRFSEGVSVNDLDLLVMLRATLSPRIAVQALGRGLRLHPETDKTNCVVLDAVLFQERLDEWDPSKQESEWEEPSPPETPIRKGGPIDLLAGLAESRSFQDVPEPRRWAFAKALLVDQLRPLLQRLHVDSEGLRDHLEWQLVYENGEEVRFTLGSAEEAWLERVANHPRLSIPGRHDDRPGLEQRLEAWLFELDEWVDGRWVDPGRAQRLLELLTEDELRSIYWRSGIEDSQFTHDRARTIARLGAEDAPWGLIAHLLPLRIGGALEDLLGSEARLPGVRRSLAVRRWLTGIEPSSTPKPGGLQVVGDLLYSRALSLVLERLGLDSSGYKGERISRLENWKGTIGQLLDALTEEDFDRLVGGYTTEEREFKVFAMACGSEDEHFWSDLLAPESAAELLCGLIGDVDLPRFGDLLEVGDDREEIEETLAAGEVDLGLRLLVAALTDSSLAEGAWALELVGTSRSEQEQEITELLSD